MPLTYHIDPEERVVSIRGSHTVESDDVRHLVTAIVADHSFEPEMSQFVDLRNCELSIPGGAASSLGRFLALHYGPYIRGRIAVLVDDALPATATARVYKVTSALPQAELFDDYGFALRWLVKA